MLWLTNKCCVLKVFTSGVFLSLYLCSNLNNFTKSFIDFLLTALGQTTVGLYPWDVNNNFTKSKIS